MKALIFLFVAVIIIFIALYCFKPKKEDLSYFSAENVRYWPYYYYSFPYNYEYGGAWPPGMFSRLYFWSPGYYTGSGQQYFMRPGMGYKYWPRNQWIRQTRDGDNSYYYLSNRQDYVKNAADYSGLGLWEHS